MVAAPGFLPPFDGCGYPAERPGNNPAYAPRSGCQNGRNIKTTADRSAEKGREKNVDLHRGDEADPCP